MMDGVAGGYPDRREDEQPGIAPIDASVDAADQVAPTAEATVQSTVPVEQPDSATEVTTGPPADVTTASGSTVAAPRKYGLLHALGVPVKPEGRGSPVPRSAVDDHIQEAQEKVRRDAADAQRHQAVINAVKRQIQSQDAQGLHDAYEAARMFGIDPATLTPQSRLLKQSLAEQEQMRANYFNDQKNDQLTSGEKLVNQIDRKYQGIKSGFAINSLHINAERRESYNGFYAMLNEMIANGEPFHPEQQKWWKLQHQRYKDLDESNAAASRELMEAQARLARLPKSTALRQLGEAKTVGDFLEVVITKPGEISAVILGEIAPTAVIGISSTLLLGPLGGVLAAGALAFGSDFPNAIVEGFVNRGVDLQNQAAVSTILANRGEMEKIHKEALIIAGIAATVDAASAPIGKMALSAARQKIPNRFIATGARVAAEGGVGAVGEAAEGLAIKGELEDEALIKGFGKGAAGAGLDIASDALGSAAKRGVRRIGDVIDPYYEKYRASRNPTSVPVDYNQSNARLKEVAEVGKRQAHSLAEQISTEQELRGRYGDKDDGTRRLRGSFLGPETLYISREAADRLRQSGILTDELSAKLGISKKWLDNENARDLAKIDTIAVMTSNLKKEDIDAFTREIRIAPRARSVQEAAAIQAAREAQIESRAASFESAGDSPPDGFGAYRHYINMAKMRGDNGSQVRLKAAEFAERYINLAIARGRGETADSVFYSGLLPDLDAPAQRR